MEYSEEEHKGQIKSNIAINTTYLLRLELRLNNLKARNQEFDRFDESAFCSIIFCWPYWVLGICVGTRLLVLKSM